MIPPFQAASIWQRLATNCQKAIVAIGLAADKMRAIARVDGRVGPREATAGKWTCVFAGQTNVEVDILSFGRIG